MNKKQLAERLARQSHRSRGEAADDVDKLVYSLLRDLRTAETKALKQNPQPAAKPPARSKAHDDAATATQVHKAEKKTS